MSDDATVQLKNEQSIGAHRQEKHNSKREVKLYNNKK